ncbi:hypothetical protein J8J04_02945, partial ['Fragaria x ananassa' phyllody phytoplasma]|nr:hypothetical protein ['Fragaria x ananassa' phyllody phytoplasma]
LQTQGISTYKNDELTAIDNKKSKLQSETSELVGQIGDIKVKIGKLESKQRMYEDMLSSAQEFKKDLESQYTNAEIQYKQSTLSSLNSLYEII